MRRLVHILLLIGVLAVGAAGLTVSLVAAQDDVSPPVPADPATPDPADPDAPDAPVPADPDAPVPADPDAPVIPTEVGTPTATPPDAATLAEELATVRGDVQRLWGAYYLARAASQLADAEDALRANDLTAVEQTLVTVGASLDQAYARSAEQYKGPLSTFRTTVATIYGDLRVRPEGSDVALRQLRQNMLSLIEDEGL